MRTDDNEADDSLRMVGGDRMDRSIADFRRACVVLLEEEQRLPNPNNALISVLCDAVRLSREYFRALDRPV